MLKEFYDIEYYILLCLIMIKLDLYVFDCYNELYLIIY